MAGPRRNSLNGHVHLRDLGTGRGPVPSGFAGRAGPEGAGAPRDPGKTRGAGRTPPPGRAAIRPQVGKVHGLAPGPPAPARRLLQKRGLCTGREASVVQSRLAGGVCPGLRRAPDAGGAGFAHGPARIRPATRARGAPPFERGHGGAPVQFSERTCASSRLRDGSRAGPERARGHGRPGRGGRPARSWENASHGAYATLGARRNPSPSRKSARTGAGPAGADRKSTRLNSSH